jgi:hypothetical protein
LTPDGENAKKKEKRESIEEPRLGPLPDPFEPKHPMLPKATSEDTGGDKLPGRTYAEQKDIGEDIAWVSGPGIERGKGKKLALTPEERAKMQGPAAPEDDREPPLDNAGGGSGEPGPAKGTERDGSDAHTGSMDDTKGPSDSSTVRSREDKWPHGRPHEPDSRSEPSSSRRPLEDRAEPRPPRRPADGRPVTDRREVPSAPPSMKYRRKVNPKVSPMTIPTALGGKTVRCPSCGAEVNTSISSYCYKSGGSVA